MGRQGTALLSRALLASAASIVALSGGRALAQDAALVTATVPMEQRVDVLERQVREQQSEIAALKQMLARSAEANDTMLAMIQGRGLGGPIPMAPLVPGSDRSDRFDLAQQSAQAPLTGAAPVPGQPVGEAPADEEANKVQARVAAVPEGQGVLTRKGTLVIEPSLEYALSSTNRLVFRGIELVPGIQIGVIEASNAERLTLVGAYSARYGLTNNLQAEVRVPYLYRSDRIDVVQQRDEGIVRTLSFKEKDIGDIEFGLRYQVNRPRSAQQPIFTAGLSVKSDTGKGPFDIGYDEFGIATGLTTGSGFWAVAPSLNFLLPSDPVVIYGGVGYLWHMGRDINKDVGGTFVGHVNPGDAISANLGFGFALNPRFSFSLGYRHSYLFPTTSEIGGTIQKSSRLQVGSLSLGMAYRLTETTSLNFGVDVGVTEDAPDVSLSLRVPFSIDLAGH